MDLGASWVELGFAGDGGGVQGENLDSHEVLTWSNAVWHVEVPPSTVGEEGVDSPLAGTSVESPGDGG